MSDAAYFRTQANKCRRLARDALEREAKILKDMADEYDVKAMKLERS